MLKLKKIAVTGGLGSGKSTVCQILKEMGAYVVSADRIVHQLLTPDTALGKKVVHLLGSDILVDNQIDRMKVAQLVFQNESLLKNLEDLLHPRVAEEIEVEYAKTCKLNAYKGFVAEIPLLFETGAEKDFDQTILVTAEKALCEERFCRSTGYTKEEFNRRSARQMDPLKKREKADLVIDNCGSIEELKTELYSNRRNFFPNG